jgi:hypothetical protein
VMIWYHHVGGIWYLSGFCVSNPLRSHSRVIWISEVAYIWVRGLVRPV